MLASPVARVYAEALFGIAKDRGEVDATGQELQDFLALVRDNRDIATFLSTPLLEPAVKVGHLRKALDGRCSEMVCDFLCFLVGKRRADALGMIVAAYRDMADRHASRTRVKVRTATPLSEPARAELESVLRKSLSKEVVIDHVLEPEMLGGAIVGIGDKVYDGSVRNRLNQFRKQIMRSGGYEAQG